jgi:UPF0271 protein
MAAESAELALAVGRAIKAVDPDLIYLALAGSEMERAGEELGLRVAREAFVDRLYDDDGNLTSRKVEGAIIKDPELARERIVHMVREQVVISRNGKAIPTRIETVCVHGDEPTAIAVAKAAREGLEAAGILVVPLTEMDVD